MGKKDTRGKEKAKAKIKVFVLVFVFVSAIFNIAVSWGIIANTMSWIYDYIARPMLILLIIISIITVIIAIGYCFVKKKSFFIVTILAFACMIIYSSLVFSAFSHIRPQPKSMKVFLELTDIKNINILNISDLSKTVSENENRTSILGKNSFEVEYHTWSGRTNSSENYNLTQEIFGSDNLFFVNHQKLINYLTNYYITNDVWNIGIIDDDIYSFTKGDVNCICVYKTKTSEHSPDYELAYYAFVISNNEKVYVASYELMCTNPFTFDAVQTTQRIVDELISNGCL